MTDLTYGIAALLADPTSRLLHCQVIDRLQDDAADVRAELLKLVIAHKDNDGPRLAYAEWCERTGEGERGEFIRVQCELASMRDAQFVLESLSALRSDEFQLSGADTIFWLHDFGQVDEPGDEAWGIYCDVTEQVNAVLLAGWVIDDMDSDNDSVWFTIKPNERQLDLRARERELWKNRSHLWEGATGAANHITWDCLRRGFIAKLRPPADWWLAHGDAIMREHPVERVRTTTEFDFCTAIDCAWIADDTVRVAWADVYQQMRPTDRGVGNGIWHPAFLRLRWPGIEFELSDAGRAVLEQFANYLLT